MGRQMLPWKQQWVRNKPHFNNIVYMRMAVYLCLTWRLLTLCTKISLATDSNPNGHEALISLYFFSKFKHIACFQLIFVELLEWSLGWQLFIILYISIVVSKQSRHFNYLTTDGADTCYWDTLDCVSIILKFSLCVCFHLSRHHLFISSRDPSRILLLFHCILPPLYCKWYNYLCCHSNLNWVTTTEVVETFWSRQN